MLAFKGDEMILRERTDPTGEFKGLWVYCDPRKVHSNIFPDFSTISSRGADFLVCYI